MRIKDQYWYRKFCEFGLKHSRMFLSASYLRASNRLHHKYCSLSQNKNIKSPFPEKVVISMIDDEQKCRYGLSDRLMGIISVYLLCKRLSIPFKIHFVYPFDLELFLVPNKVDWHIDSNAVVFNADSLPVQIYSVGGNWEKNFQAKWLTYFIKRHYSQIHIYTNAHFCMKPEIYSPTFHELFKMSDKLKTEIDGYLQDIGEEYISMTFRFQQLLGDFKEYKSENEEWDVLDSEERDLYITRCLKKVEEIYEEYGKKILVTSDSSTFLQKVSVYPFVYVVFGELVHMGITHEKGFENHKKAFIDFFMIANADIVILARTGKMYKSIFPYSASLVNKKMFRYIEF